MWERTENKAMEEHNCFVNFINYERNVRMHATYVSINTKILTTF